MEKLFQYSSNMISEVDLTFKRYLWGNITWKNRLNVIVGARGVGKTTLMLQYIKENLPLKNGAVIYVSLDDFYFAKNSLVDFAGEFVKRGGKYLFLDEVHKYKNWSQELKSTYDYFPELKIVATGSSALNIYKGKADLSRRAILYKLNGLSFREFIAFRYGQTFPVLTLAEIVEDPNLAYALTHHGVNSGSVRETFFYNQLHEGHQVLYAPLGDFIVDDLYTFEVSGKNKKQKQMAGIEKSYIAGDNIEYNYQNRIPLWLFGFLY